MESTYKHTITTIDGTEVEVTLNRLTMRHGFKLQNVKPEDNVMEIMVDMISPGTLDIISPKSLGELFKLVEEKEAGFFAQMTEMLIPKTKPKVKRSRKSKKKS